MIEEMDAIKNPTMRERIERGIIKPIISTKEKFGLGVTQVVENKKNYQPVKKTKFGTNSSASARKNLQPNGLTNLRMNFINSL